MKQESVMGGVGMGDHIPHLHFFGKDKHNTIALKT